MENMDDSCDSRIYQSSCQNPGRDMAKGRLTSAFEETEAGLKEA